MFAEIIGSHRCQPAGWRLKARGVRLQTGRSATSPSSIQATFASSALMLAANTATAAVAQAQAEQPKAEITVLYDAFGKSSTMKKDRGSPL